MSHILLATLGTTPQVLTEAFYYYKRHMGIAFNEVHVITTVPGAKVLKKAVLGPRGVFVRLCRDLGVSRRAVRFGPSTIHVLSGADGSPVGDVRSTMDGGAVAQQMLDIVRRVCSDPDTTVHAIVSGGRKVTSIYLHAMMQLAGRPHDKLFHILVHPAIEEQIVEKRRRRDFFYPRGPVRIGGRFIPENELLAYIEVPLLCVSPRDSLAKNLPWDEIVRLRKREVQWLTAPPTLTIDPPSRQIRIGDVTVHLPARQFFWYYVVARLAADGRGALPVAALSKALRFDARAETYRIEADPDETGRLEDVTSRVRAYYHALFPFDDDTFGSVLKSALRPTPRHLRSHLSKVNTQLRDVLGAAAQPYEAHANKGRRGAGEHGLSLPADQIRLLPAVAPRTPGGG